MPKSLALSTTRRSASTPALWPAIRGSPRETAQRPLPSMMTAACKDSILLCGIALQFPHGIDQCFHVIQIFFERTAADVGDTVFGLRQAALKGFVAGDIAGLFELARMDTKIPIGGFEQLLELVERQCLVGCQSAHDAEPHALVNQAIELGQRSFARQAFENRSLACHIFPCCVVFAHGIPPRLNRRTFARSSTRKSDAARRIPPPGMPCPRRADKIAQLRQGS